VGEVINLEEYRRNKKRYKAYSSELNRLWVTIIIWTPYDFALEKQINANWMNNFFYPDEDW